MVLFEICYALSISYASKHIQVNRQTNLILLSITFVLLFFSGKLSKLYPGSFTNLQEEMMVSIKAREWAVQRSYTLMSVKQNEFNSPTEVNATYRIFFSWSVYTWYVIITDILRIRDFKHLSTFLYNKVLKCQFHF